MKYTDYILSNEQRSYFGIDPIDDRWDEVELKSGFTVYFDGDIIRKTISCSGPEERFTYSEKDTVICTRNRQVVLPRTAKGKEKKLNFTSVSSVNPSGCVFMMNLSFEWYGQQHSSSVRAWNNRNCLELPVTGSGQLATLIEYKAWLEDYIATCPPDYFEKVERMRNEPHRTVRYYNGDIFRFEIDREHYGFGLISGQVLPMRKDGTIPPKHALNDTMMVPLLVRCYLMKTKDRNMPVSEIISYPLSPAFLMGDNCVIWGRYDIVGSKKLDENDIDFPVQIGESIDQAKYIRFCWGTGMVIRTSYKDIPPEIDNNRFLNHGVAGGVNTEMLEKAINNETRWWGIHHPDCTGAKKNAYGYFGLPADMTFDEFNIANNGMTRAQYAGYANQYSRKK